MSDAVKIFRSELYVPQAGMYDCAWMLDGNTVTVLELHSVNGEDCSGMLQSVLGFKETLNECILAKTSKIKLAQDGHKTPKHLGGY